MKIFCIGRNYIDHAKELSNPVPSKPLVFSKPPTSLLKSNKPFFHPEFSKDIHHEVEVILKISKNGKNIAEKFAHKYYHEISLGIDFTARDIQSELKEKGHPWEIAKGFDNSAVIGPFIDLNQIKNINDLEFRLEKNNEIVQKGNTKDMIFSFDHLVSYISQYFTLQAGDLIYTGTPAGVGKVEKGDLLEGFIETEFVFKCEIK